MVTRSRLLRPSPPHGVSPPLHPRQGVQASLVGGRLGPFFGEPPPLPVVPFPSLFHSGPPPQRFGPSTLCVPFPPQVGKTVFFFSARQPSPPPNTGGPPPDLSRAGFPRAAKKTLEFLLPPKRETFGFDKGSVLSSGNLRFFFFFSRSRRKGRHPEESCSPAAGLLGSFSLPAVRFLACSHDQFCLDQGPPPFGTGFLFKTPLNLFLNTFPRGSRLRLALFS